MENKGIGACLEWGRASHGGNIEVFNALIFLKQIFLTTWWSNCDEAIRGKWRWRPGGQLGCLCRVNLEITVAKGTSFDISQSWVGMQALLLTRYVGYLFPFLKKLTFLVCKTGLTKVPYILWRFYKIKVNHPGPYSAQEMFSYNCKNFNNAHLCWTLFCYSLNLPTDEADIRLCLHFAGGETKEQRFVTEVMEPRFKLQTQDSRICPAHYSYNNSNYWLLRP